MNARETDPHRQPSLDADGIRIGPGWHRHGLLADHGDRRFHVRLFVLVITIQITAEIQPLPVELLERGRELERKPNNLVRNHLFFEGGPGLGAIVHNAGRVPPIIAVGRTVVARIRIVKHFHADALDGVGSLYRGHIGKLFRVDSLERPLDDLAAIAPSAPRCVREIRVRVGHSLGSWSGSNRGVHADRQHETPPHQETHARPDLIPPHRLASASLR